MTSTIILTKDNLQYTTGCLESIFEHTSQVKTPFEIIVVDNGSKDGTVAYLKSLETADQIKAIYNQENLGFPKGVNQGAAIAKGEYLCLLNNDVILTDGWLDRLLRCIKSDPLLAAVGPYNNCTSGPNQSPIPTPYKNEEELQKFAKTYNQEEKYIDFLVFFCALIKKSVWDELGGLDVDFTPGNYEDNLFCYNLIKKGYKLKICGNVFLHHYISRTWHSDDPKKVRQYASVMARNQKLFTKKIGQYKTISLCMICSDMENPDTFAKCLDSIYEWVDEVCVVFNYRHFPNYGRVKKLRQVIEILKIPFDYDYIKWPDSFSKARNRSLDMATSDYILVMDVDDEMLTPSAMRDLIRTNPEIDYFSCQLHSQTYKGTAEIIVKNMLFKNKTQYRYRNKIHEDISFSMIEAGAKRAISDMKMLHKGYLADVKTARGKNDRNLRLCWLDYKESPHSLVYYGLVNALIIKGGKKNLETAIKLVDECFEKCKLTKDDPLTPKMWMLRGIICLDAGQHLAAKQSLHKAHDEWQWPEATVNLAEMYMKENKWDKAIEILNVLYEKKTLTMTNISMNYREVEHLLIEKMADCYGHKGQEEKDKVKKSEYMKKAEEFYRQRLNYGFHLLSVDRLCQILRNTNRMPEASFLTVKAVNKAPGYYVGWCNIGQDELFQGRQETAKVFFRECLRHKPDYEIAKHNLEMLEKIKRG